jgi:flagellar biosynthesis protein FlhA
MEELVTRGVNQTEFGSYLALDPSQAQAVIDSVKRGIKQAAVKIEHPVILCSMNVRRHLKNLCDRFQVQVTIFSHNEIPNGLNIQSVSTVSRK